MKWRRWKTRAELDAALAALLARCLYDLDAAPQAVMLAGGTTFLRAYEQLARRQQSAGSGVHILFSDERHVPVDSPESNERSARPLIRSLALPEARVLRVETEYPLEEAARRYHEDLDAFLQRGGRIRLGLLGLGADGHTASLFSDEDIARGRGRWAVAVPRPTRPNRVSVTAELLTRVDHIVVGAVGPEKAAILQALERDPNSVVAGRALVGAPQVEIWMAEATEGGKAQGTLSA